MAEQKKPPAPELITVFSDMFRAVARPVVTIIFAAVIAQAVIEGIDVPQWFLALAIPVIGWWFAERTVTHLKSNNTAAADSPADTLSKKVVSAIYNNTSPKADPKVPP